MLKLCVLKISLGLAQKKVYILGSWI